MALPSIFGKLSESAKEKLRMYDNLIIPALRVIILIIAGVIFIPLVIRYVPNIVASFSRQVSNDNRVVPLIVSRNEDFFLLDEPDFLPEILLEREVRTNWAPDDVLPFWRSLVNEDREKWQERIETVIDELLEGVP